MPPDDDSDAAEAIARLISTWNGAQGHYTAPAQPGTPTPDHAREIGHYAGETLYGLADTGTELVSGMSERKRVELAQGITLEWFNKTRTHPHRQTLGALAFVADLLHAAIDGVQGSGRIDVSDAHDLAVQLQERLNLIAGNTDIVEGMQQLLAEAAGEE